MHLAYVSQFGNLCHGSDGKNVRSKPGGDEFCPIADPTFWSGTSLVWIPSLSVSSVDESDPPRAESELTKMACFDRSALRCCGTTVFVKLKGVLNDVLFDTVTKAHHKNSSDFFLSWVILCSLLFPIITELCGNIKVDDLFFCEQKLETPLRNFLAPRKVFHSQ